MSAALYTYFWGRRRSGRVECHGRTFKTEAGAENYGKRNGLARKGWGRYRVPRTVARKPRLRANAGGGAPVSMHGAFAKKADARRRAREIPGAHVREKVIRGKRRYMVLQSINGTRRGRARPNPPKQTKIYDKLREIVATKGAGHQNCDPACRRAAHTYRHVFTSAPPIFGTADGSLRIPANF